MKTLSLVIAMVTTVSAFAQKDWIKASHFDGVEMTFKNSLVLERGTIVEYVAFKLETIYSKKFVEGNSACVIYSHRAVDKERRHDLKSKKVLDSKTEWTTEVGASQTMTGKFPMSMRLKSGHDDVLHVHCHQKEEVVGHLNKDNAHKFEIAAYSQYHSLLQRNGIEMKKGVREFGAPVGKVTATEIEANKAIARLAGLDDVDKLVSSKHVSKKGLHELVDESDVISNGLITVQGSNTETKDKRVSNQR